jgi:hypothetical protein
MNMPVNKKDSDSSSSSNRSSSTEKGAAPAAAAPPPAAAVKLVVAFHLKLEEQLFQVPGITKDPPRSCTACCDAPANDHESTSKAFAFPQSSDTFECPKQDSRLT